MVNLTGTGVLAGACLRASLPPLDLPALLPIGLAIALMASRARRPLERAWVGGCMALVGLSMLPFGLLAWGTPLCVLSALIPALLVAGMFALSALVEEVLSERLRPLGFPITWVLCAPVVEASGVPLALSAGWASTPALLALAPILGVAGSDALIATLAAGLSQLGPGIRCDASRLGFALAAVGTSLAALGVGPMLPTRRPVQHVVVHAVQPGIPTWMFRQAQTSLYYRHIVERRIDDLTAEALLRAPGVVAFPEGGNGLFNARLTRRHAILARLLRNSPSELLLAGADLTPAGELFNVVHHVTSAGLGQTVRKAHPAPYAEERLGAGDARTVRTKWGSLGISICLDAAFGQHARALVEQGAEALIAVSDDASFGLSYLAELHMAYARIRALEVGRSLLFLSNRGPVAVFASDGREVFRGAHGSRKGVLTTRLPLTTLTSWAQHGGRWSVPLLCLALLGYALARYSISYARTEARSAPSFALSWPLARVLLALQGLVIGVALASEAANTRHGRRISWEEWAAETASRAVPMSVVDELSPLFRQRGQVGCGPAALAYALTSMGDELFEEDLSRTLTPRDANGYSLLELQQLARSRGFDARGYAGSARDLPRHGEAPVIAHLRRGHYVVVLATDDHSVHFFDPALGTTRRASHGEFGDAWSGHYLRLHTQNAPHPEGLELTREGLDSADPNRVRRAGPLGALPY